MRHGATHDSHIPDHLEFSTCLCHVEGSLPRRNLRAKNAPKLFVEACSMSRIPHTTMLPPIKCQLMLPFMDVNLTEVLGQPKFL
jgi:hypothetical protein